MPSKFLRAAFCLSLVMASAQAAPLRVVVTIPDLGWLAEQVGGQNVSVKSLLRGSENPHFVDAVPSFIKHASRADVLCFVGMGLEVGWLPNVLARSRNRAIQSGGKGHCQVSKASIDVLGMPKGPVDRSMGDVHGQGNPHFWLSPLAMSQVAAYIQNIFTRLDPAHRSIYEKNTQEVVAKLKGLHLELTAKIQQHQTSKNKMGPILVYHQEFNYFLDAYGLSVAGSIEEKPGVPPSAGRLARVAQDAKSRGIQKALAAMYDSPSILKRFSKLSGVQVIRVPTAIQPKGEHQTYPDLQRHLVSMLLTEKSQ